MNPKCFVIQPFQEPYLKLYNDTYSPAITEAGFCPIRVDLNPGAKNLIEEIEQGIKDSDLCFAEISSDNPNVWYELGYAFALGKNVVMVCEEGKRSHFPFDISHKHIIQYKSDSPSDFNELKEKIVSKINALKEEVHQEQRIIESPLQEINGLQPYESTLLAFIVGDQKMQGQSTALYWLNDRMNKVGFTDIASSIGLRLLERKGFITTSFRQDEYDDQSYPVCELTKDGEDFVINHLSLFELSQFSPSPGFDSMMPM